PSNGKPIIASSGRRRLEGTLAISARASSLRPVDARTEAWTATAEAETELLGTFRLAYTASASWARFCFKSASASNVRCGKLAGSSRTNFSASFTMALTASASLEDGSSELAEGRGLEAGVWDDTEVVPPFIRSKWM